MERSFACIISFVVLAGCAQSTIESSDLNPSLGDQLPTGDAGSAVEDASRLDAAHVAAPEDAAIVDASRPPTDASVIADAARPRDASVDASSVFDAGSPADAALPSDDASTACPACPFPGSPCMTLFATCGCQLIPLGTCLLPPFF